MKRFSTIYLMLFCLLDAYAGVGRGTTNHIPYLVGAIVILVIAILCVFIFMRKEE